MNGTSSSYQSMLLFALMQISTATKHARQSFHIITHTLAPPSHPSNTPLLLPSLLLPKTKRPNPLPQPPHLPFRLHKRLDPHHRRVGASDRGRGHVDAAGSERVDEDVQVVGGGAVVA